MQVKASDLVRVDIDSMIKDIVVNLPVGTSRDVATHFAVSVAAKLDAYLTGIAFWYEPLMPVMVDMYGISPGIIESQRIENEKIAKTAVEQFNESTRLAGISGEARVLDASVADAPGMLARIARRFDLSVIAQPEPNEPRLGRLFVEAALFESGRPVLIVPYIQTAGLKLDRVMVCWDGSRSAARAVGDAMPFLVQAKTTEIVVVSGEPAKSDELPGADIAHHLTRHGAKVEVKRIVSTEIDVANTILSSAADASVDLLVMGGYGHSRMREFILGGVTRGILASMTVPTLMSH
jgi:nucleotide-binding universal stress UspA family protein